MVPSEIGMTDGERNIPVANPQLEGGAPVVYFARAVQPGVLASDDDPGNSGDPGESDAPRDGLLLSLVRQSRRNRPLVPLVEGGHDPSRSDARGLPISARRTIRSSVPTIPMTAGSSNSISPGPGKRGSTS